jgi:very-short-patch-repair endonuclease
MATRPAINRFTGGPGTPRFTRAEKLTFAQRMRREPTESESLLWRELRSKRLDGIRFRRQHCVFGYIVDFYAPRLKLVVEVDGGLHDNPIQYSRDCFRDRWMTERGLHVYRIPARSILADAQGVLRELSKYICGIGKPVHNAKPSAPQAWTPRRRANWASS